MNIKEKTACLIMIGDEILSGRVKDKNSHYLIQQLSKQGVKVQYNITIPDDREIIAETLQTYTTRVDWVFTSGGIGSTPDDITLESIAYAFEVPLLCSPVLLQIIKNICGEKFKEGHKKMAYLPEGTYMIQNIDPVFPALQFQNIYMLPGIPAYCELIFSSIKERFQGKLMPFKVLDLITDEGAVTASLIAALNAFPNAKIGSYPSFHKDRWHVRIVVEHENKAKLDAVFSFLKKELTPFSEKS